MCSHLIGKILSLRQQDKLDCSLNVLLETFPKPVKCTFRLPMDYLEETDVHTISPEVSADLELLQNLSSIICMNPEAPFQRPYCLKWRVSLLPTGLF